MKDNSYSKVEGILYEVPRLKAEIANLQIDLEEMQEVIGIRGASPNEKAGSTTYAFSSAVEDEVIIREERLEEKVQALAEAIRRRERQVKKVTNALEVLSEKELLLVEMRYFKHYSVNRICEVLDITTPTFNRRKNGALKSKLIPLLAPKQYKSDTKMIGK